MFSIFLLIFSAYGFYHAVQIMRGERLNFKPFNCKLCLSFWYSLIIILLEAYEPTKFVAKLVEIPLAVAGAVVLLCIIEDRISYYSS